MSVAAKVGKNPISAFLYGLRPIKRIRISEWAQQNRKMPKGNAINGAFENSVTPYAVAIMDALSVFSSYQEVIFMKGAQVAATTTGENFVGYYMDVSPVPILIMYPTVAVAKRNSKRRIGPMIADTDSLREKVAPAKSRTGGNTILEKEGVGFSLLMVGANSPSDLRSVNICCIVFDEIDEYPTDLEGQGDPIEIGKKRAMTYGDKKKILYISTPTVKGASHIEKEFNETDQNHYYIPCPHCAPDAPITYTNPDLHYADSPAPGFQKLVLENFVFTPGKPEEVWYRCIHCAGKITNADKHFFLPRGQWVSENPELKNKKRIGFHLPAFYSGVGLYSWEDMATDYDRALKSPTRMKTFVQTIQGLPYEEEGEQPSYQGLFERSVNSGYRTNEIPDEVCFLTAGVDVQNDRIEIEIVGWGKGKRSWSIDYRVLDGRPTEKAVWVELEKILSEIWVRESDGMMFGLNFTLIDEGHVKNSVYLFCLKMGLNRILPCKGSGTQTTPISAPKKVYIRRDGKKSEELQHVTINVDFYKSALYGQLNLPLSDEDKAIGPEMYCHFPNNYELEHYKRLTAEKRITIETVNGFSKQLWKKASSHTRNEQLDTRVYAMAAATLLGIDRFDDEDYDRLIGNNEEKQPKTPKTPTNNARKLPKLPKLPKPF